MGRKGPAIGIDLGTTCSCVGVFQNGKVEIIANDQSNRTTPSYVAFTETERLIGDAAFNQVTINPENTIYDIKRVIGRKFKDLKVQQDLKCWPFKVVDDSGQPKIEVEFKGATKMFAPEEIYSMLLMKMKETAETYLDCQINDAVISIPAHFNDSQRQATKDAATIAGLNVLRLINDPTAAALSYAFNTNAKSKRNVLIFDLGGGTFDVSVLTIDGNSSFEVKATAGHSHLGGEDFNNILVNYLVEEFQRKNNQDISGNHEAMRQMRIAAEKAKITLSSSTEASIEIDALDECTDFHTKISRAQFEELCADLFRSTIQFVEEVLSDAKLSKNDIEDIVMVGGSIKIPKIQQLLQNFFGDKELNLSINAYEAVACGAAIQAAVLSKDRSSAIQDLSLVDVTSLSLGIEAAGGAMVKLIERNSRIPCKQTQTFTTFLDEQPSVVVKVYEGENTKTSDNNCLGEFHLIGLPITKRGTPKIDVSFNLDANGILNVEAKEVSTGRSNNIVIHKGRGRLSPEEIDRMVKEAESYKAEEASQRERISTKSELEDYLVNVKRALDEADDKLPESEKDSYKQACEEVSLWLKNNTLAKKEEIDDKKLHIQQICAPFMSQVLEKGDGDDTAAKIEA